MYLVYLNNISLCWAVVYWHFIENAILKQLLIVRSLILKIKFNWVTVPWPGFVLPVLDHLDNRT